MPPTKKPKEDYVGKTFGSRICIDVERKAWGGISLTLQCAKGHVSHNCPHLAKTQQCRKCSRPSRPERAPRQTRRRHNATIDHKAAYASWKRMLERTTNPSHRNYVRYGAAGIVVCDRWKNFANFLEDMGDRPDGMTLDRIDNSLGYFKENCRWATQKEQQRNRRHHVMLTYNGETKCLAAWAESLGIVYNTMHNRYLRGNSIEQILAPPRRRKPR